LKDPRNPLLRNRSRLSPGLLPVSCGGCGFAILYNGTWRNVLYVGAIALIGNELRLLLYRSGVPLPLATFLGALAVGLTASIAGRWIKEARVALTVPAAVLMVPGLYAWKHWFISTEARYSKVSRQVC
jgi:uncharacterized membrane protein YjjB (DUF3815 family)